MRHLNLGLYFFFFFLRGLGRKGNVFKSTFAVSKHTGKLFSIYTICSMFGLYILLKYIFQRKLRIRHYYKKYGNYRTFLNEIFCFFGIVIYFYS